MQAVTQERLKELTQEAQKGDAEAMCELAVCYKYGEGVTRDYAQAYVWYQKAAALGSARGKRGLSLLYEKGQGVEQDLIKAASLLTEAAESGCPFAQLRLSYYYMHGKCDLPKDDKKANYWQEKAAEDFNPDGK